MARKNRVRDLKEASQSTLCLRGHSTKNISRGKKNQALLPLILEDAPLESFERYCSQSKSIVNDDI